MAKQINGYFLKDTVIEDKAKGTKTEFKKGQLVPTFGMLADDGSTASGNWVMAGSFDAAGANKMAKRGKEDPTGLGLYPNWSYAWPVNRRIIYNRASCDLNGKPYNPKRKLLEWTGDTWVGDVPDGPWPPQADKAEGEIPLHHEDRTAWAPSSGPGWPKVPSRSTTSPWKARWRRIPCPGQLINPAIQIFNSDLDKVANADAKFPYVCTTYSCTEHWCSGALTRWQAWLLEMQPELYVEIGDQLAKEKGIENGERVQVSSVRGNVECVAMVTKRFRPFLVEGKTVHQVGLPFNYGWLHPQGRRRQHELPDADRGRCQHLLSRVQGIHGQRDEGIGDEAMKATEIVKLIDTTRCTACRGCQVACKQWNEMPGLRTRNFGSYQNPPDLQWNTWTLIRFQEHVDQKGNLKWLFRKDGCMHCTDAACVKVCPIGGALLHGVRNRRR